MSQNSEDEEREKYQELLQELRTIIPGAQVLLAFLLTVPFASRFEDVDALGKLSFTVSLLTVAAATILFLAPAAYHRLAGHRDRRGRLQFGVRTAMAGLFLLAISVTCAIFVVVRFLYDNSMAGTAAAAFAAALAATMWYVLPARKRN